MKYPLRLKMICTFLVLTLAPSVFAQTNANTDRMIQVKPLVQIDGAQADILVGDILSVRGLSETDLDSLRGVKLTDTPKPGESRSFTALAIEETLLPFVRQLETKLKAKVSLRIPARVTVTRKVFSLSAEDVEAEMRAQLKGLCSDCQFEISNLKMPLLTVNLPSTAFWSLRMRSEVPRGSFSLPLEIKTEAGPRTFWVGGQLNVTRTVPVLVRQAELGEKLRPEDFVMQSRDVTFALDQAPGAAEIASSVTARQIAAGQILWRNSLKREMALKLGDTVRVISGGETESASWQVSVEGIAQGAGYLGDIVKVKIPKSQKLISGILKEKGLVEVQ